MKLLTILGFILLSAMPARAENRALAQGYLRQIIQSGDAEQIGPRQSIAVYEVNYQNPSSVVVVLSEAGCVEACKAELYFGALSQNRGQFSFVGQSRESDSRRMRLHWNLLVAGLFDAFAQISDADEPNSSTNYIGDIR